MFVLCLHVIDETLLMNNLVDLVEEFSSKLRRVLAFMASLNPLLLPPETTPNTITRLHDQFQDLTSGMSLGDNHLMQQQPALKVGIVVKYFCIGIRPNIFAAGHGSLSSLISLGHFSSASFISEEKANLEIQKLRQELREEHERVKRLQCQLSTNVSDSNNFCQFIFADIFAGSRCVCIRAIIGQHDFQTLPAHSHCRTKGLFPGKIKFSFSSS